MCLFCTITVINDRWQFINVQHIQIRFGRKYLKIYVKYRGDEAPYKQVNIEDFTNFKEVPPFKSQSKMAMI